MPNDKARCMHESVQVEAHTERVIVDGEVGAFLLAVQARCAACGATFWFPGMQTGKSYTAPATSTDGFTAVLPMVVENSRLLIHPALVDVTVRNGDIMKGTKR